MTFFCSELATFFAHPVRQSTVSSSYVNEHRKCI